MLDLKKFWAQKILSPKKILGPKQICVWKILCLEKFSGTNKDPKKDVFKTYRPTYQILAPYIV